MNYKLLCEQLEALASSSRNYIPLLSNTSALLNDSLKDINWVGFYLVKDNNLLLGPFQGKVACVNIEKGKGVCGTAYEKDETIVVDDVHKFAGHIACDSDSNSEIVIPIHSDNEVIGVLDIDSPIFSRFTEEDRSGLEAFVSVIKKIIVW